MSESTAALIPFDRLFKFTASALKEDYRVNLFKEIKKENAELLGLDADEEFEGFDGYQRDKRNGIDSESECGEDNAEGNEDNAEDNIEDNENKISTATNGKKTRKLSKKVKELEYDYDDPFIDDSEITDVYQSVFELMRGGGGNANEGKESNNEESNEDESDTKDSKATKKNAKPARKNANYFVYRGTMTPEILAKEFEIAVGDLMENESIGSAGEDDNDDDEEDAGSNENSTGVNKKKRKKVQGGASVSKKIKTTKSEKPKKPKAQKTEKPQKPQTPHKASKPNDLITQSAKKFNDLFSTEDGTTTKTSAVFNVNGVDANLLELREVLKRFRDSAVGTPFSPGKFPSILRPRLNETICTCLRLCRPTVLAPLPKNLLPALASFLPFSPTALNKLLTRKILGPLIESVERGELIKMYGEWRGMVEKRACEDGAIVEIESVAVAPVECAEVTAKDNTGEGALNTQTSAINPVSPVKRKLRFSDEMRQLVFEIIRAETDLNNLIALSKSVESSVSTESVTSTSTRTVQSELNLRKNVYQKLVNLSSDPAVNAPFLSTTEISKEFGSQKRKHEKRIAKAASEIIFGEGDVEEFLREMDVKKIVSDNTLNTVTATTTTNNNTNNNTAINQDPLNLFNDNNDKINTEEANTSLFFDSNQ